MTKPVRHAPRSQDDLILRWLDMRCRGVRLRTVHDMAGAGNSPQVIHTMMDRVRKADIKEGPAYWGDDVNEIRKAYWT